MTPQRVKKWFGYSVGVPQWCRHVPAKITGTRVANGTTPHAVALGYLFFHHVRSCLTGTMLRQIGTLRYHYCSRHSFSFLYSPCLLPWPSRFAGGQKGLSIFHKKYEQHNKRHRQGYADDLGMRLSRIAKVSLERQQKRRRKAFGLSSCTVMSTTVLLLVNVF